jgi:hypothetical protein
MDSQLIAVISGVVHQAYPEPWETAWLSLPLSPRSPYTFCVMCADLPGIKDQRSVWPPAASNPKTWIHWEQPDREGFWIRPRKDNPILRDRLILVRARELLGARRRSTIDQDDVMDACSFAAQSLRFVWHNPAKGGASQPHSAHFQSAPLYWHNTVNTASRQYTVPCCLYQNDQIVWHETKTIAIQLIERGLESTQYPILGLAVSGLIESVASFVWSVIWDYDQAAACNLAIQPNDQSGRADRVRVFVFPRSRKIPNYSVTEQLLTDAEQILTQNNHDGRYGPWSFAGVEMGLLTQIEWGPIFETMQAQPSQWGNTLLRLVRQLTLDEQDHDWVDFVNIVAEHSATLQEQETGRVVSLRGNHWRG